ICTTCTAAASTRTRTRRPSRRSDRRAVKQWPSQPSQLRERWIHVDVAPLAPARAPPLPPQARGVSAPRPLLRLHKMCIQLITEHNVRTYILNSKSELAVTPQADLVHDGNAHDGNTHTGNALASYAAAGASITEQCARFGEILGLDTPVDEEI